VRRITKIKNPVERLKAVYHLCASKSVCDRGLSAEKSVATDGSDAMDDLQDTDKGCGNTAPYIRLDSMSIVAEYRKPTADMVAEKVEKKQFLNAHRVHSILKRISVEDCLLLGFEPPHTKPDWMVCTVLPVPPPAVRPSIVNDNGTVSQDDLTFKLGDIVKWSAYLKEQESNGSPAHIIADVERMLQYHVATLTTNNIPSVPASMTRSGRPLKSIAQRLKGKEGRLRGNLMGKRVDFSARTVITPDPNVSIDEVGVPRSIALNLTYPEVVTPFNIDRYDDRHKQAT
jgi:DNA-directed RNA polymerase II subunit RPB1